MSDLDKVKAGLAMMDLADRLAAIEAVQQQILSKLAELVRVLNEEQPDADFNKGIPF